VPNVESCQDSAGVSWKIEESGVKCFISYSEDIVTHDWDMIWYAEKMYPIFLSAISLILSKDVPLTE
jgi:hypothetical protein